jgi:hypothetical protein
MEVEALIKYLKALPIIFMIISLISIMVICGLYNGENLCFGHAVLFSLISALILYVSLGAYREIKILEKRLSTGIRKALR